MYVNSRLKTTKIIGQRKAFFGQRILILFLNTTLNFAIVTFIVNFTTCILKILFSYSCIMNISQKLYNRIHIIYVLSLIFFFYILYTSVLLLRIKYQSCLSVPSFSLSRFFSNMKLVKTLLPTQLKQTNLEYPLQY